MPSVKEEKRPRTEPSLNHLEIDFPEILDQKARRIPIDEGELTETEISNFDIPDRGRNRLQLEGKPLSKKRSIHVWCLLFSLPVWGLIAFVALHLAVKGSPPNGTMGA